jgi:hypothetical protein
VGIATAAITCVLPENYRRIYLGGVLLSNAAFIIRNNHIGIRVTF